MGDYRKLIAWQRSQELAVAVYKLTSRFPASERFGLAQQMRRAAVSVSSNIAEGAGRSVQTTFLGFLRIARGSLHELRSQLDLAVRLGFASEPSAVCVMELAERVSQLLSGILRKQSLFPPESR